MIKSLANGLTYALECDKAEPLTALELWVDVGSAYEREDQRGLSHFLEHMVFKETTDFQNGSISHFAESFGADLNAYTTFEHTVFHIECQAPHVGKALYILKELVYSARFRAQDLESEQTVILEEAKRSLDQPGHLVSRPVFAELFQGTEVARPIIGSLEDISKVTVEDLQGFYDQWYRPERMRLVLVGGGDEALLEEEIEKLFSFLAKAPPPTLPSFAAPLPPKPKAFVTKTERKQCRLQIAFPGPLATSKAAPLFDLASYLLAGSDLSRLNQALCYDQDWASAIEAGVVTSQFRGMFMISALVSRERVLECCEGIASTLFQALHGRPFSSSELSRGLNVLRHERMAQLETVAGRASKWGQALATPLGEWFEDVYDAQLFKTTPEKLAEEMRSYLGFETPVISALVPESLELTEEALLTSFEGGWKKSSVQGVSNPVPSTGKKDFYFFEPSPGLKVIYRRLHRPSLFNVVAVSEGGQRLDGELTPGSCHAMAQLLSHGPENLSHQDFLLKLEASGGMMEGFSGKDSLGLSLECVNSELATLWPLFLESLVNPAFHEAAWVAKQREILDQIELFEENPGALCVQHLLASLYGAHPYGASALGSKSQVASYSHELLLSQYRDYQRKGPFTMAMVGDLPPEEVLGLLQDVPAFGAKEKRAFSYPPIQGDHTDRLSQMDRHQVHMAAGHLALAIDDDQRFVAEILAMVLGGAGGRLFKKLREESGLVYTVTPLLSFGVDPGFFGAYLACAADKASLVRSQVEEVFASWEKTSFTESEVERAREFVVGNHLSDMQEPSAQAMTMALMECYGVGFFDFMRFKEEISRVTRDQVVDLCRRFQKEIRVFSLVGNI